MFKKTLQKFSRSWHEKYLQNMAQVVEYYKQFNDVEYIPEVPYKSQDGTALTMDIFRPATGYGQRYPVVMMVHGGGFLMGDKHMEMGISRHFAQSGFLSVSLEYRVFPEVDVKSVILDLAGGMEEVGKIASYYGGDPERCYVVSESAGVYAAIFAVSMNSSETVRQVIGGRNPGINIRAMAALSGMYYVNRKDLIGAVIGSNVIPKDWRKGELKNIMNLESKEIVNCLVPVFLVSSKGDFLRKYTLRYSKFLKEKDKEYKLVYYDREKKLTHAFPSLIPEIPESIAVDEMIVSWFHEH